MFEINGNLNDSEYGLSNYQIFYVTIVKVWSYFKNYVGVDNMNSIKLFIDNAISGSGYTPITTPILGEYVSIKLCIGSQDGEDKIAYQFAHELMHFVYFVKYGMGKNRADEMEESICTAASLIVLRELYPMDWEEYNSHVMNLENHHYRMGADVAFDIGYSFEGLLKMV